jgi:hypothetical protein
MECHRPEFSTISDSDKEDNCTAEDANSFGIFMSGKCQK